jgi:hypothetical protein
LSRASTFFSLCRYAWMAGTSPAMTSTDEAAPASSKPYAATTAGIGSAVTDLIFSIAKREVTFFSGTALISFL